MPVVTALFFGLKAAVLVIVVEASSADWEASPQNRHADGLAAISFIAIFFMGMPFPLIVLGGGRSGSSGTSRPTGIRVASERMARHNRCSVPPTACLGTKCLSIPVRAAHLLGVASLWLSLWLVPVAVLLVTLGTENVFSQIAIFFSKMAMVTFGGAYAVLAYVAQQAVQHYGWLKPGEMLDGLGMAETTPGPLIMVLQFVGFMAAFRHPGPLSPMLAGTLGGLLATWVTFTPCFLWIFLGAPFAEKLER